MTVGTYVLAAGQGRRFGAPKLDAPCARRPLGTWILAAIQKAGVAPGIIIVPPAIPRFALDARLQGWTLVTNEEAEHGLSTSLACAISHAEGTGRNAAAIFLADMPLVSSAHVRNIVAAGQMDRPAATLYPGGRIGVPARLPHHLFSALRVRMADAGASALLAELPTLRVMTDVADLHDVDSPADLALAEATLLRRLSRESVASGPAAQGGEAPSRSADAARH